MSPPPDDILARKINEDVATMLTHMPTQSLGLVLAGATSAKATPLSAVFHRELTLDDLALGRETSLGSTTPHIARLRDTHHRLAKLMAEGLKGVEIHAITGYSQSRISILRNDPAFQELVEFYRQEVSRAYTDTHERLAALGEEAVAELHDRLVETPDNFKNTELLQIAAFAADRTGFGPETKSSAKSVHVHTTTRDLDEMKRELAEEHRGSVTQLHRSQLIARETAIDLPSSDGPEVGDDNAEPARGDTPSEADGRDAVSGEEGLALRDASGAGNP